MEPEERTSVPIEERSRPEKWVLSLTLVPIVGVFILGMIGSRTWFTSTPGWLIPPLSPGPFLENYPLWVLALNPTSLVMTAASPHIDTVQFFTVVLVRRLIADPSYFLLGYWYGDGAISWLKRRSPDIGKFAEKFEEWFPRYGVLLVLLYPHPLVMMLAGASAMRLKTFLLFDFLGTLGVAIAIRQFGWFAESKTKGITGFFGDHQLIFGVVSVLLMAQLIWALRSKPGDRSIGAMADELEAESKDEPHPK